MTIQLRNNVSDRIVELGAGARPMVHPMCMGGRDLSVDCRLARNEQGQQTVDFAADFEEPLPITSDEWDGLFCQFCLEHLSWRKVHQFVAECYRIIKPGAKAVFITANTKAQMQWVLNRNEWDDHSSCILFGDLDYPENSHKNALSPEYAIKLFQEAGFDSVKIQPYGELSTDMVIEATKPLPTKIIGEEEIAVIGTSESEVKSLEEHGLTKSESPLAKMILNPTPEVVAEMKAKMTEKKVNDPLAGVPREQLFGKAYFNGGHKFGGYTREGYADYPVHWITTRHILAKKPESVLEIGSARNYLVKRIQDVGIPATGMEISRHCEMTRAADPFIRHDLCITPWPFKDKEFDLVVSVAVLEHVPEEFIPAVSAELQRVAKRGLHGIDFGEADDGQDLTHVSLHDKTWWMQRLPFNHEIVDKEALEQGAFPEDVLKGDGKIKLNVGSFTSMYHHGWINIDVHDLEAFAKGNGYNYMRHDVRAGLPFGTSAVDLITACHSLEHLTAKEGLSFLRECRRALKPNGVLRIQVPNAGLLLRRFQEGTLDKFDEINEGCAESDLQVGKLWALLHAGHNCAYDWETLKDALMSAGFIPQLSTFRDNVVCYAESQIGSVRQIQREATDTLECLTLFVNAFPHVV